MKTRLIGVVLGSVMLVGTAPAAFACGFNPMLGGICTFAGNFAPRGYAFAHGQLMPINQYPALFSIFGTTYGGDGRTTFGLPDLRGRTAIGWGQGPGLQPYNLGQKGGQEAVTLSVAQLPTHGHTAITTVDAGIDPTQLNNGLQISLHGIASTGDTTSAQNASLAIINQRRAGYYSTTAPDVTLAAQAVNVDVSATSSASATTTVNPNGANLSHENRMPYTALNWTVALVGIFPSRS
ncbi:tail fiber protein [Aestuariibacter halophilus]|uniref:Tail fiber protein n=1 Tax=Fluctibacter halophilus TaxID=226011 RepID=A0ABS8G5K2_9ALTE|nr:tail fiber protein [Aestuariibacter halophilus]MCC2615867.1 tail fiber protein [Aestuariibacter halophilus]